MKKETTIITLRCSASDINALKEIARACAYNAKKDIKYTDIIREAISEKIKKNVPIL